MSMNLTVSCLHIQIVYAMTGLKWRFDAVEKHDKERAELVGNHYRGVVNCTG